MNNNDMTAIENLRRELHRTVDARCDALIQRLVLNGEDGNARIVSLRSDTDALKGEKPEAVILSGQGVVPVKSWRQAAIAFMRDCCEDLDRRERLMELRDRIFGNQRLLLSDRPEGMDVPLEIADGLYMEGKFDTGALLRVMTEKLLPRTGYDCGGILFQLREQELVMDTPSTAMTTQTM